MAGTVKCSFMVLVLLAVLPLPLFAADSLMVVTDGAAFFDQSNSASFAEIYVSLSRHQLGFIPSGTGTAQVAGVFVSAVASDSAGIALDSVSTYFISQIKDSSERSQKGIRLFDMLALKLAPGKYHVLVTAIDDVSKKSGTGRFDLTVPAFRSGDFQSSDIELAYEIRDLSTGGADAVNPRLIKEDRAVIPNPSNVYQAGPHLRVYAYSELYGLGAAGSDSGQFTVRYQVKNAGGDVVTDFGEQKYPKPGGTAVLSQALDMSDLGPGNYRLLLTASDRMAKTDAIAVRPFAIMDTSSAFAGSAGTSDVELMIDIAYYYLTEAEKLQLDHLTTEGKRSYIKQFWQSRDTDPTTPDNPVYDEAVRRFNYAVENFSTRTDLRDGWKTSRGRIYITYGPPDMINDAVMSSRRQPYIKWTYYQIEGGTSSSGSGVIFIFSNDYMAGAVDYRLVHSTHPHEKYDPVWQQILENQDEGLDDDMR